MCKIGAKSIIATAFLGAVFSPQIVSAQGFESCPDDAIETMTSIYEANVNAAGTLKVESCYISDGVLAIQFSSGSEYPSVALNIEENVIALHDGRQGLPFRASMPHRCIDFVRLFEYDSVLHEDGYHTCLMSEPVASDEVWSAKTLMEAHAQRILNGDIDPSTIESLIPGMGALWPNLLQSKLDRGVTVEQLKPCLHEARGADKRFNSAAQELQNEGYGTADWAGNIGSRDFIIVGIVEAMNCVAAS